MAHIPDGLVSLPVTVGGTLAAAVGLAVALRALDDRAIPKAAVLAAVFFVASLVAVPIGPTSTHLMLGGLAGLVLGPAAFASVFVGLTLQALFFGFGGLTTLGVNTLNIALPAVVAGLALRPLVVSAGPLTAAIAGAVAGALAVVGTGAMVSLTLALSSADYAGAARLVALTYLPLAGLEAAVTGFAVGFLVKARPDLLGRRPLAPAGREA